MVVVVLGKVSVCAESCGRRCEKSPKVQQIATIFTNMGFSVKNKNLISIFHRERKKSKREEKKEGGGRKTERRLFSSLASASSLIRSPTVLHDNRC